jgi:CBS-domain-containing membrane protein
MQTFEIMTHPVISVAPEISVVEAARLMLQHRVSGLPVVDDIGCVVGMITEGDLLRRAETGTAPHHSSWLEFLLSPGRLAQEYTNAHARKVAEVMTKDIVYATPQTAVADVVQLMTRRRIKRLPVIEDGRLVGIISRADLVRALINALVERSDLAVSDDEIYHAILHAIEVERWAPRFTIEVKDGVVDLLGTITDERQRTALQVLVENIPGVKKIVDQLVWADSVSSMVVPH